MFGFWRDIKLIFRRIAFIQANIFFLKSKSILTKTNILSVKSQHQLDPPIHTRLFVTNSGKVQYVSDPYLEHYFANKMDHFQLKQLYGGGGQVGGNKEGWIFSKKKKKKTLVGSGIPEIKCRVKKSSYRLSHHKIELSKL